jgi:hypothetical protein
MPLFTVKRRVDAYVDYVTQVRASNAQEAAELASVDECGFLWELYDQQEFDARIFITLDVDGCERAETEVSDC